MTDSENGVSSQRRLTRQGEGKAFALVRKHRCKG
jgi:hypothetical protein